MKRIRIIIFLISLMMFVPLGVKAASTSTNISSNVSTVVVGNKVTYTIRFTSNVEFISLNYELKYSDNLTLISGSSKAAIAFTSLQKSVSYTFVFKAKSGGNASVNIVKAEAGSKNDELIKFPLKSKSIRIITQKELEASYSKNNNLASLGVVGYSITPVFNANTLEYNLEVENHVRKVTVNGSVADSRSTVSGFREYALEEGVNKIVVTVTAQNGLSKKYTINVNVKELVPIEVLVDNIKYNVVRKESLLVKPNDLFTKTTIMINDLSVPAFINEKTNITLVGLKDEKNEIKLYEYKDSKYTLYNQIIFSELVTTYKKIDNIPKGFISTTIKINDISYDALQKGDIYLINLLNLKTGKTNLYRYDKEEQTIQVFDLNEKKEDNSKEYVYTIIILSGLLFITYTTIIYKKITKNNKNNKKNSKKSDKIKGEIEKESN